MSKYTLNGKDMAAEYGFIPGRAEGSNLALQGAWDMPARIGKTYHDWGNQIGIQPYVLPEEIRFGGRNIILAGYIQGATKTQEACFSRISKLIKDLNALKGLAPLSSDKFGSWNVLVNGEINAQYIGQGIASIRIPFREPVVDIKGVLPVNTIVDDIDYDNSGIDNIPFADLGFTLLSVSGTMNRPSPKSLNVTAYANEGYIVSPPGARTLTIKGYINSSSFAQYLNTVKGMYALMSKPGIRFIKKPKDVLRKFFGVEGFKITNLLVRNRVTAFIEFKIIEVGVTDQYYYMADKSADLLVFNSTKNKIFITK